VSSAELGSGSAKKRRLLLAECAKRRPTTYLAIDVSREMLAASGDALTAEFPKLTVHGLWGNIGNTTPTERAALLAVIAATLRLGDRFLTSADLQKPTVEARNSSPGSLRSASTCAVNTTTR
jgi:L-histidine N-alpha-methyltransferase